jgi:hypothetical protein
MTRQEGNHLDEPVLLLRFPKNSPDKDFPKSFHLLVAMFALIHLLFLFQMLCNHPRIPQISFWLGKFGTQTLQFIMTVYAVTADPIVSPIIIISFGCGVYFLSLVEIALEMIIEMVRAPENAADHPAVALG